MMLAFSGLRMHIRGIWPEQHLMCVLVWGHTSSTFDDAYEQVREDESYRWSAKVYAV